MKRTIKKKNFAGRTKKSQTKPIWKDIIVNELFACNSQRRHPNQIKEDTHKKNDLKSIIDHVLE